MYDVFAYIGFIGVVSAVNVGVMFWECLGYA